MNTCRLCKKMRHESSEDLLKYGVRHYAHLSCALTEWGEPFLDRLPVHQLGQLSWMVLSQHNMLFAVKRRIDEHAVPQKKEAHV